jgi:2-polyprenyl-6-methoxyphenol hydroxylase-like FAD-dependent oxidoreductase
MRIDVPSAASADFAPSSAPPGKRVAIVGAGPGGLSAGIALSQAGFHAQIFERNETVDALGGAILLNAIGIYILRSYGVGVDDLFTAGVSEFRRYDGHFRARWKTDEELLTKAGVSGWISGMMRSEVYERMLSVVPDDMIVTSKALSRYDETDDDVTLHFTDGTSYTADVLIAADGINSAVRPQLWGPSELKHLGIAVWLGWAELEGPARTHMVLHHNDLYQLGYAPLRYREKNCFEYWFVEPCTETQRAPEKPVDYMRERLGKFAYPVNELLDATDPDHGLFRWVVKTRDPLKAWSKGRVTLLGDAAHPTSPYAGYGAGMAIEDGFFLGKYLAGRNLADRTQVETGLKRYDEQRVDYCNGVTAFARTLGKVFHNAPWPLRRFRDFMLDHTRIPDRQISKGYTQDAQVLLKAILDADSGTGPTATPGPAAATPPRQSGEQTPADPSRASIT